MKKFYLTLGIATLFLQLQAQKFSMEDLVSLTHYTTSKFDNYVAKKGYRASGPNAGGDSMAYTYFDKKAKEEQPDKQIFKVGRENTAVVAFQTTELGEFTNLSEQLKKEGYRHSTLANGQGLYQKGSITITTTQKTEEEKTVYSFVVENKILPKARDIVFAEDFLQLASHEYLSVVFGEGNVKRDVFYFSENEVNRCSVLFPNSNRQVIFIWKDEVSHREIDFVVVGGHLRAASSGSYNPQIELNAWQSRQGIRAGMSLHELEALNGSSMDIYAWNSEQPGVVSPKSTGSINFKSLGVALSCMDCAGDQSLNKNSILKSADLLLQGRRVYVCTIIILPTEQ